MQWNDVTNRTGLVQDMEDICGLGETGITNNTTLFQKFTRWANIWLEKGTVLAVKNIIGWDFDDPSFQTDPSGTFAAQTTRNYVFGNDQNGAAINLLKIKNVGVTYDAINYIKAQPIDSLEDNDWIRADTNVDSHFSRQFPKYDPKANGFDLFPNDFTTAEINAGAKIYVEFFREPKTFATSGTDSQEPAIARPFHELISKGASLEYCKLYKPDLVPSLRLDIFGGSLSNGVVIEGILAGLQRWYSERYPQKRRMTPAKESNK